MTYASNQIFIITKAQEKDGTELSGYRFTIKIHKSRFVREGSKFPFTVRFDRGILRWSGLMDLAIDAGFVIKPKVGWYQLADPDTGEVDEKLWRLKDLENNGEVWSKMIAKDGFKRAMEEKFMFGTPDMIDIDGHVGDEEEVD